MSTKRQRASDRNKKKEGKKKTASYISNFSEKMESDSLLKSAPVLYKSEWVTLFANLPCP